MTYEDVLAKYKREIRDLVVDFKTNEATVILTKGGGFVVSCPEVAYHELAAIAGVRR